MVHRPMDGIRTTETQGGGEKPDIAGSHCYAMEAQPCLLLQTREGVEEWGETGHRHGCSKKLSLNLKFSGSLGR